MFGSTVDLEDEDSGAKVTYQIVGDDEADLKLGLISISSPIARALIGKDRRRRRRGAGARRHRRATRSSAVRYVVKAATLARVGAGLAGAWAGMMVGIGGIAAPALFQLLPRADAGRVAGRLFSVEATVGVCVGALLVLVGLQLGRDRAERGNGLGASASS